MERVMNGTDKLYLHPRWRSVPETHEPKVWRQMMSDVRPGDVVADVGANIGLYAVALAKRVGPSGRVFAFEPDPLIFPWLKRHIALNKVGKNTQVLPAAVGPGSGEIRFLSEGGSQSHVAAENEASAVQVPLMSLDDVFSGKTVNLVKIDVEGYEELVLKSGLRILRDPSRCPRVIYVEVHPYAWPEHGTSSESFLGLLASCGYRTFDLAGSPVITINSYGEVVARKL